MAENTEQAAAAPEAAEAPKKKPNKLLIIIIAVALAGGGGFFAYGKFFNSASGASEKKKEESAKVQLVPLDPFILNLSDQKFLKLTLQFEMDGSVKPEEIKDKIPELRDAIITLVSSKPAD